MDWAYLVSTFTRDSALPARATRLLALTRVLEGKQYDHLPHAFSDEFAPNREYIKLRDRRPSVRSGLCRTVVEDSASLLFSEGHWPSLASPHDETVQALTAFVKERHINAVMLDAAQQGSVGSVVLRLRVLKFKPFVDVLPTAFLTPIWQPDDPSTLQSVTQRYKVKGRDLRAAGYAVADEDLAASFWFQRVWTDVDEQHYLPQRIDVQSPMRLDTERSVHHGLGFVPLIWVRNLPGGDDVDGACTFEPAISTTIEADYLLSQAGRGLNYSSDPKTVLTIEGDQPPQVAGGSANALVLPKGSDARLLEINGSAARAVIEHVRELRAMALEVMHGNRAHADRMSAATSGVALQAMMEGLLWVADRLRISYGEGALLDLFRMVSRASQAIDGGILIAGKRVRLDDDGLELRWPQWLAPTPQDLLTTAQAVVTAYAGETISQKAAVTRMASILGIDDPTAELERIEMAAALLQASEARSAANDGRSETRSATA